MEPDFESYVGLGGITLVGISVYVYLLIRIFGPRKRSRYSNEEVGGLLMIAAIGLLIAGIGTDWQNRLVEVAVGTIMMVAGVVPILLAPAKKQAAPDQSDCG